MSFIRDILKFEKFNLKDILGKIKDDPERILLGLPGVDPWGSKLTGAITGKDYEPLVDQFGGAYGGDTVTLGDTGEGVYGRAREAGVPTEAGAAMHDLAHVISASVAGGYGMSQLPIPEIPGSGTSSGGGGFDWSSLARLLPKQEPPPQKPLRMLPLMPIQQVKTPAEIQAMMNNFGTTGTMYG